MVNQLEIANDPGGVRHVMGPALLAVIEMVLGYMATVLADRIRDVVCEVVAAGIYRDVHQRTVLLLGQVFVKIIVQGNASIAFRGKS